MNDHGMPPRIRGRDTTGGTGLPEIRIARGMEGASVAIGLVVVIDVFRAFTTACHAAAAGARPILPAGPVEEALELKHRYPGAVTAGERLGRQLEGFDFGNSPALLESGRTRLCGRPFIQATHAGTRGLLAAGVSPAADEVLAASLVNARATACYIRIARPAVVTLVPMGWAGEDPAEEDDLCAEYLAALIRGETPDTSGFARALRGARAAGKFFDPAQPWAPEEDFTLCLRIDHFPFALRLERDGPAARLVPVAMVCPRRIPV